MVLPLGMLSRLQMRLGRKIALAALFCVAFVTIALDILRTYESVGAGGVFAYSALYCTLEITISTMLACAPTYRSMFGIRRNIRNGQYDDMHLPRNGEDETRLELVSSANAVHTTAGTATPKSQSVHSREPPVEHNLFGKYTGSTTPAN